MGIKWESVTASLKLTEDITLTLPSVLSVCFQNVIVGRVES